VEEADFLGVHWSLLLSLIQPIFFQWDPFEKTSGSEGGNQISHLAETIVTAGRFRICHLVTKIFLACTMPLHCNNPHLNCTEPKDLVDGRIGRKMGHEFLNLYKEE
jgi:hypothetical protein